jgi:heme A synthase
VLIGIGGLVRGTGSGLGCTSWPKCSPTSWLPPLEYHALIEYSHRMTVVLVTVLIVLLFAVAWRTARREPRVLRPSAAALVLVFAQAALGAITVRGELKPLLVTAHFATAMVLAAALVLATVAAYTPDATASGSVDPLTRLARWAAGGAFALLLVGTYVRGEGAGLAFRDWPLMDGRVVPHLAHIGSTLMFAHRLGALVVAGLVAVLAVGAWRERVRRRPVALLSSVAAGLLAAQVLIGAANVWSKLAPAAVVAHVTVAGLIWGALVAAAAVARVVPGSPALSSPAVGSEAALSGTGDLL